MEECNHCKQLAEEIYTDECDICYENNHLCSYCHNEEETRLANLEHINKRQKWIDGPWTVPASLLANDWAKNPSYKLNFTPRGHNE